MQDKDLMAQPDQTPRLAVPLPELAEFDERTTRRGRLLAQIKAEHTAMLAAIDGQVAASYSGDTEELARQTRRLVHAELVASGACAGVTAYYEAGSPPAVAFTLAADALVWAAWREPEHAGAVLLELRAQRAAEKASV